MGTLSKICVRCNNELSIKKFRKKKNTDERQNICINCVKNLKDEGLKKCSKCDAIYPRTEEFFAVRKREKDGLDGICKKCNVDKISLWQRNNKEKANKKSERYRNTSSGRKSTNLRRAKYNSKVKTLPNTLNDKQWAFIKNRFNNTCAYCGQNKKLEHDHVIPVSNNGELTHNNIVPSCRSCNASKRNKEFKSWYRQQEFYSPEREKAILEYLGYKEDKQQLKLI